MSILTPLDLLEEGRVPVLSVSCYQTGMDTLKPIYAYTFIETREIDMILHFGCS
jgi:hypothetical protein